MDRPADSKIEVFLDSPRELGFYGYFWTIFKNFYRYIYLRSELCVDMSDSVRFCDDPAESARDEWSEAT